MIDVSVTTPRTTALLQINRERDRQEQLRESGRFVHTCADAGMDEGAKLACLMEEVGEVATNVLARQKLVIDGEADDSALYVELSHVAAIAVAWMESVA